MPTVPMLEAPQVQQEPLPGRAYPRVDDNVSAASFGAGLAQGIDEMGSAGARQGAIVKQQNDHARVVDANTQLEAAKNSMLYGQQQPDGSRTGGAFSLRGIDAINMPAKILPHYDAAAAGILQTLTPDQQRIFKDHIAQNRNELDLDLNRHEYNESNRLADTVYQNATKQTADNAALGWRDPKNIAKARLDMQGLVQLQGDREGWDPTTRDVMLKNQMEKIHAGVIEEMSAEGNTSTARTYLLHASSQGEMEPKAADSMLRMLNAQDEHKLAMDDKLQRDASNSLLKNAIKMSQDGKLTPQWIEQHHATWEPQAYEYVYGLLAGKETKTDPHTFAPLLTDALSGKDVTGPATDALYSGKISLSDFKSVVDKSEAPRKGYVARGVEYINTSLKPNPQIQDPAGQRSLANALDDFRSATDAKPDMSDNEARTLAHTIADHYQIVAADKATVFMPVPLHLVGTRMTPDLKQTWAATKAARESGEMSDEEYQRQAALLQQWLAATAKKTPPAKAPAP